MTRPRRHAGQYRIAIRGDCTSLLAALIEGIQVEPSQDGNTRVVVQVTDESAFWGVLYQLQDLAVHIISIHELTQDGEWPAAI